MTAETASIDYSRLANRSVLITGGASGLGAATATKFAQHGAYVTIADMQDTLGTDLSKDLTSQGHHCTFISCNTTSYESSLAAFKHCINFSPSKTLDIAILFAGTDGERAGLVDYAINNGGKPSLDSDPPAPTHRAVDVNLLGVYMNTYLALHYFRLQTTDTTPQPFKKSLILISSMTAYIDLPYNTGYSVSKYGIRGLFRSIRSQVHKVNARVNNIAPGYVLTPLTQKVHRIERAEEVSKATGTVLPWAKVGSVVEAVGRCAVDEGVDGRSWSVVRSGYVDQKEDVDEGWGGDMYVKLMRDEGLGWLVEAGS